MADPTEEELVAAHDAAVHLLLAGARSPAVVERLIEKGLGEAHAFQVVKAAIVAAHEAPLPSPRDEGFSDIGSGLILLAVAGLVSFFSLAFASGGGRYFIAGGAVLVGVFFIIKGVWRASRR